MVKNEAKQIDAQGRELDEEKGATVSLFKGETSSSPQFRRNLGKHFAFWFYKGEPLITIGPHWPFFLCLFSVFLIVTILVHVRLRNSGTFMKVYYSILSSIQLISYAGAALKNEGLCSSHVYVDETQHLENNKYCKECMIIKDSTISHCSDCKVCIKGFDHHCAWTGKCIGKGNLFFFYIFVANTVVFMISSVFSSVDLT